MHLNNFFSTLFKTSLINSVLLVCLIHSASKAYSQSDESKDYANQRLEQLKSYWSNSSFDSVYYSALSLKQFAKDHKLIHYMAESNYYLGRYFQNKGNLDSSNLYLKSSNQQYSYLKDTSNIGKTYFLIGINYTNLNQIEKSLNQYYLAKKHLAFTSDSVWNSLIHNYISITHFEKGNYPLALHHSLKSLDYLETSDNYLNKGNIYNTLGNVYRKMQNTTKEKEAYKNAIDILSQAPENLALAMAYNNISELYLNEGKTKIGFGFLEKAKETFTSINFPLGMCSYYAVKSHYYFYLNPPNYDSVIHLSKKSMNIAKEYKDYRQFADASYYLGRAYLYSNQVKKAQEVLQKAYKKAEEYHLLNEITNISHTLSEVYEKKNRFDKSLEYYKIYSELRDSLYNADKIKEFTSLDLKYQFDRKQLQDSLQNQIEKTKIKLEYETEIKTHNLEKLLLFSFSIFFIGFAIFLLFIAMKRKKTNSILQKKNQTISKQSEELEANSIKIKQAFDELKELDYFKQSFISMLVHDLKNPLNALVNIHEFNSEQERLELTKHSSAQMLRLVLNMLDISKAENNSLQLEKTHFSILKNITEAKNGVEFLLNQKGIKIEILSSSDHQVYADYDLINRVITNLLVNAIKYSPQYESILIKLRIDKEDNLQIIVKDKGQGIGIEDQKHIFDLYKQIQPKRSGITQSSGIGLAFCKLAIEAHLWEIGVHSSTGLGAEFWVKIPQYKSIAASPDKEFKAHSINSKTIDLNEEEIKTLLPFLIQLQKQQIFAISEIKNILANINALDIPQINQWTEEVYQAVSSYDEGKYTYLINSLLNS